MPRDDRQRLVYDVLRRHGRGESIRGIAKAKGIDRRTVRSIVSAAAARREQGDDALVRLGPQPRAARASKLDAHLPQIDALLEKYPDLTAVRLLEELRSDGFEGGYSIVRDLLRQRRPRAKRRAHDPVHTEPGRQLQVDWSPYGLATGEGIEAFSAVLHFSRYQCVDFSADRQQLTLFRHLDEVFQHLEGVPHELVFDSEKTVVDRWEVGQPIINLRMLDFAAYYGFAVHIAPRADGAYKGAVERPFWFLEQNFFNGRTFHSLDEARKTLAWWLEERANGRTHRTTGHRPVDLLAEEKPHLLPLPAHPYDTSEVAWRIVDGFHRVALDTNTYTVPPRWVGHRVCLRATEKLVEVYDGSANLLARHDRAPRGAKMACELSEHRVKKRLDVDQLLQRFAALGERAGRFAVRLRQHQRYAGVELAHLLGLQVHYRLEDLLAALDHALDYGAFSASAVERILEAKATRLTLPELVSERLRQEIRRTLAPVRQRGLRDYQRLLSAGATDDGEDHDPDRHEDTS